jgi:hypothetical protein
VSDLQAGWHNRLNECHDERSIWEVTANLQTGQANLVPEVVWNIQTRARRRRHETHQGDGSAAAVSLVSRLGIQGPEYTLIQKMIGLPPNGDIIRLPLAVITLETRLDKAEAVIDPLRLLRVNMNAVARGAKTKSLCELSE